MKKTMIMVAGMVMCCHMFVSCSKEKDELSVHSEAIVELYSGERKVVEVVSSTAEVSIVSSNPYSVSASGVYYEYHDGILNSYSGGITRMSNGRNTTYYQDFYIKAKYVGSSVVSFSISSGLKQSVYVIVKPRYTTYDEPDIDFDDTRDSIVQKLGRPHVENNTDTSSSITYYGYSTAQLLILSFDQNDLLDGYALQFYSDVDTTELRLFLEERYARYNALFYIDADNYSDATRAVTLMSNYVFYTPANRAKRNDGSNRIKAFLKEMDQLSM